MPRDQQWAEIEDVICNRETEKAVQVRIKGADHWVPKSVISEESEVQGDGDEGTLVVAEWFAEKEELTDE